MKQAHTDLLHWWRFVAGRFGSVSPPGGSIALLSLALALQVSLVMEWIHGHVARARVAECKRMACKGVHGLGGGRGRRGVEKGLPVKKSLACCASR
eukprot:1979495-Rhodomonas_salina.1